jgi:threonine synthase
MDVGAPSNWERIDHLLGGQAGAQAALRWGWASDDDTRNEIMRLFAIGQLVDPHAAVASAVLRRVQRPGEVGVFLATAHPAKFPEELERLTGRRLELPPELAQLAQRPLLSEPLAVSVEVLRVVLNRG